MADMSTYSSCCSNVSKLAGLPDLDAILLSLESDSSLLSHSQLKRRLIVLDELDATFGGLECTGCTGVHSPCLQRHVKVLARRLEAANTELYQTARSGIVCGGHPHLILAWLEGFTNAIEVEHPSPGLGFDHLDELMTGILQLHEPGDPNVVLSPEMVPYQPTPVRHIFKLIQTANITENDSFVDLGSGLGHVPLLVSMLAGAQSLGIELQTPYVASAAECARSLQLDRVRFVAQDAREASLTGGTVFYLFTPFKGSVLNEVLLALQRASRQRPIKVCSLGPCTQRIAEETWLKARGPVSTGSITVFDSL